MAGAGPAAIGAGGSIVGGGLSYLYSKKLQRISHEFTERMSNTRYQRTVKDMKLAGINPILAAQSGLGGGGSPSGTAGGSVRQDNPGAAAMMAMKQSKEMDQIQANTALQEATKIKHTEEGKVAIETAKREIAQAAFYRSQGRSADAQAGKTNTENRMIGYRENEARTESEYMATDQGQSLTRFSKGSGKVLGGTSGLLSAIIGMFLGSAATRRRRPGFGPPPGAFDSQGNLRNRFDNTARRRR